MTTTEAEEEAAPSLAPVPGSMVPPWREGLPVTVLAPDCQRILGVLEHRRSTGQGPLRTKEIAVELDLVATSAKLESTGSGAYNNGNRASGNRSEWDRTPELPGGPAFMRVSPEDHPLRNSVRSTRSKIG
ncbi:hypothetical protein RM704_38920 [Streptomyces sp. DSM 3412]|uniref:Uncharacterized protein n=1 Tax=Streptomyces gottesmaniae TaxID=3075518 RepID=A0ABU2ZAG4_9ACTN|nr:hypothetical protein [Streptomyces sp. DSM 3412]MDT0573361.1 hypothetical protein [Streptomyces sp. DSM 3412]